MAGAVTAPPGGATRWNVIEGFGVGPNIGYEGAAGDLPGAATMTAAAVFYGRNITGSTPNAFVLGNQDASFDGWGFELNAAIMRFQTSGATAAAPSMPDMPPRNLAWAIAVGVRDVANDRMQLFLNGSRVVSTTIAGAYSVPATAPSVGYHAAASGRPLNGGVAAFAYLAGTALTEAQIVDFTVAALEAEDMVDGGAGWEHYWTHADLAGAPASWVSRGTVGGLTLSRQGAPSGLERFPKWY